MRKSKISVASIFLCVVLIVLKVITVIQSWGSIAPSDGKPLLNLTYYAPAVILLILRIVVFASQKVPVRTCLKRDMTVPFGT